MEGKNSLKTRDECKRLLQLRGAKMYRRTSMEEGAKSGSGFSQAGNRQTSDGSRLRLRRPSEFAEFELRPGDWRVFYRVRKETVEVVMIGEKRGDQLLIEGEEFQL